MEKRPKTVKIRRKTWTVEWVTIPNEPVGKGKKRELVQVLGLCDDPKEKERLISINKNQSKKEMLSTYIHEFYHSINPRMSEQRIEELARDLGRFLWRIGVRP